MKIAHITSVHRRDDTRILLKQCRSLAEAGHDVYLIVADGLGDELRHGAQIVDVGAPDGRIDRMSRVVRQVRRKAVELGCDVCHIHDPELLPSAIALKRRGCAVIYDAHEDYPRHVLSKHYLHSMIRRPIAHAVDLLERWACPRLDAVVAATGPIATRLRSLQPRTVTVANYPLVNEFECDLQRRRSPRLQVCYIGSITRVRGIIELVDAMSLSRSGARLALGGDFAPKSLELECGARAGWALVDAHGHLDRPSVLNVLRDSIAGLVTLHPEANFIESQPVKMFEYMSAGLPVIASDFPLWRSIIDGYKCGLLVDPLSPPSIAKAIDQLASDPDTAERLGRSGRNAIEQRFNWSHERTTLLTLYDQIDTVRNR